MFAGALLSVAACQTGVPAPDPTPVIPNSLPVAVISGLPTATVSVFDVLRLDGTKSTDSDGRIIGYQWFVSGIPYGQNPWFIPPQLPAGQTISITLQVTDDAGGTSASYGAIAVMGPRPGKWEGVTSDGAAISFTVLGSLFLAFDPSLTVRDCRVSGFAVENACYSTPHRAGPGSCKTTCTSVQSIYADQLFTEAYAVNNSVEANVHGITNYGYYAASLNFGGHADAITAHGNLTIGVLSEPGCTGLDADNVSIAAHWTAAP